MLRTTRTRLIVSSLLAVGLPLTGLVFFQGSLLFRFYLQHLQRELTTHASLLADAVRPHLESDAAPARKPLAEILQRWQSQSDFYITVIDEQGLIRAATIAEDVGSHVSEKRRPGFLAALSGRMNATVWRNPRLGNQDSMYVNLPVRKAGAIVGAVRVAYTLTQIQENIQRVRRLMFAGVGIYALAILLLTLWLARTLVKPIEDLNRSALLIAEGDLSYRVSPEGTVEVQQLAGTLNEMTARLQHLEESRRRFVSDVSHELRTPLTAIRTMAETILQHGKEDPTLSDQYLPRMMSHTDRLARLATQLLDLAQIESGELYISPAPVSIEGIVQEAATTVDEAAIEKGVSLNIQLPANLPPLQADRDRLLQVFLNLLHNAVRHTPSGGQVKVSAWSTDGTVHASVSDTGEGIPAEQLPNLFERFHRVDRARSRQSGGTGLGLSIVKQVVQAHGGNVEVRSEVNKGTTFTLSLPVRREKI